MTLTKPSKTADTYEDFLDLIRAKGYEIKGETFDAKSLKYISFRPLDCAHFIRGRANSLGSEYTKERIKERIEAKALIQPKKRIESATINWTDFLRVCTMTAYEERNFNHVREKTTQTAAYLYVRIQTATCSFISQR